MDHVDVTGAPASNAAGVESFEALLADLLAELVGTPASRLDDALVEAQARLCRLLGAHRTSIWRGTPEAPDRLMMTHVSRIDVPERTIPTDVAAMDVYPWIATRLRAGEVVAVPDLERLPADAPIDLATARFYGHRAMLALPLGAGHDAIHAALGFVATGPREWPDEVIARCRLVAQVLHSVLSRKRAEEAARAERAQLRAMLDSTSSDLVWCVDPVGFGLLAWNEAFAAVFRKYRDLEVRVGLPPEALFPEDSPVVAQWHGFFARALREGPFQTEYVSYRGVNVLQLEFNRVERGGVCTGISVFGRDITDRRRDEDALRHNEARLRAVVESSPDGILHVQDGRLVFANRAAAEMLGCDVDALASVAWASAFEEGARAAAEAQVAAAVAGRPTELRRLRLAGAGGEGRLVESRAVPLAVGGAPGALVSWHDVTEHDRLEARFRHAQKMEAVGRLAAGVAHDINNQLTVIQGYASFVMEDFEGDPRLGEPLAEILNATRRAQSTTTHLLAFARRQVLEPERVDVGRVLLDLQRAVSRLIGEDVAVRVEVERDLPRVCLDVAGLHQALMNLVVNARDAMPAGGQLALRATRAVLTGPTTAFPDATEGAHVLVEVADTGSGMDAATLDKAGEPFFTTKEAGKGTGLGLSMVLGFTRQSRGHVSLRSAPGAGTTVGLLLPAAEGTTGPLEVTPRRDAAATARRASVLLVEDEAGVRDLVARVLRRAGYDVVVAVHAEHALELARQSRFDILVTDMVMPGLRGDALAERLLAADAGLRVLFMTGYVDEAPRIGGPVLYKPFSTAELVACLDEMTQNG